MVDIMENHFFVVFNDGTCIQDAHVGPEGKLLVQTLEAMFIWNKISCKMFQQLSTLGRDAHLIWSKKLNVTVLAKFHLFFVYVKADIAWNDSQKGRMPLMSVSVPQLQ